MSADGVWPWSELGLAGRPEDPRDVRRAYARLLKLRDGTEDVASFERLRQAYEQALRLTGETGETGPRRKVTVQVPDAAAPIELPSAQVQVQAQDTEAEALPRSVSPAKLTPWGSDPRERLFLNLSEHLARDRLDPIAAVELHRILASAAMDDPDTRRLVEQDLVAQIMNRNPSRDWIRVANRHFGWRDDGVGFQRRFPRAVQAQQSIINATGTPPKVTVEMRRFEGKAWIRLGLLGGSFLTCLLILRVLLVAQIPGMVGTVLSTALTALIVGTLTLLAVLAMGWWMARSLHRNRQRPCPSLLLTVLERWWSRPLGRFSKAQLIPAVLLLLSMLVITPVVESRSGWSEPWRVTVATESNRLFESLSLSGRDMPSSDVDERRAVVPNFVVPYGIHTDPTDPYDIAGLRALVPPAPIDTAGPLAILSCLTQSSCEMAMRLDLAAVHSIVMEDGRTLTGSLSRPVIRFQHEGPGSLRVVWEARHSFRSWSIERTETHSVATGGASTFLEVQMFMPALTQDAMRVPLGLSGSRVPLDVLDQPIGVVFEWPQHLGDGARCMQGGNMAPLATCNFNETGIRERQTWRCPDGTDAISCRLASHSDDPQANAMLLAADASLEVPETRMGALLRMLMSRLMEGGQFPALPDSPEVRALHAQVLRDYALILDQPQAEADRRNSDALRAALSRQPHLYGAMKADAEIRQRVWKGFLSRVADLGFRDMQ